MLLTKSLCLFVCSLQLVATSYAEKGVLVIHVQNIDDQAVEGIEVAAKGSSESGKSDRFGLIRLRLDPTAKVGSKVELQVVNMPGRKQMAMLSPLDEQVQVPLFENESLNYVTVVVVPLGDKKTLGNKKAVSILAAKINKADSTKSNEASFRFTAPGRARDHGKVRRAPFE